MLGGVSLSVSRSRPRKQTLPAPRRDPRTTRFDGWVLRINFWVKHAQTFARQRSGSSTISLRSSCVDPAIAPSRQRRGQVIVLFPIAVMLNTFNLTKKDEKTR